LRQAGFTKFSSDLQALSIGATNLIFAMIAMTLIDRLAEKAFADGRGGHIMCLRESRTFSCRTSTKIFWGLLVC